MGAHNFNTTVTDALKAYRSRQKRKESEWGRKKRGNKEGNGLFAGESLHGKKGFLIHVFILLFFQVAPS